MVFGWLWYKQDVKEDVKQDVKEEVKEDEAEIIPDKPPKLVRQTGIHKGDVKDIIFWKNYDEQFKQIEEDIKGLREILNSDEKWKARLSPADTTRTINKKKRKKK